MNRLPRMCHFLSYLLIISFNNCLLGARHSNEVMRAEENLPISGKAEKEVSRMVCLNIQSWENMVNSGNCISEWVGHQIKNKKRGVWKNTQQTGRGQIQKRLVCHIKGLTQSWRNGKLQKIFKHDNDSIGFVFCKDYFVSYMEELEIK